MEKSVYTNVFVLVILAAAAYWYYNQTNTTLTVYNSLPYEANVSIKYVLSSDSIIDQTYHLDPGEIVSLDQKFEQATPSFLISHSPVSSDEEFVAWHAINGEDCAPPTPSKTKSESTVREFTPKKSNAKLRSKVIPSGKRKGALKTNSIVRKVSSNFIWWKLGREGHCVLKNDVFSKTPGYFEKEKKMDKEEMQRFASASRQYQRVLKNTYVKVANLKVVNGNPYRVFVAVKFVTSLYHSKVKGWYLLGPGEELEFTERFYGETPNIAVFGNSTTLDAQLVNYINEMPLETYGTISYFQANSPSNQHMGYVNSEEGFEFDISTKDTNIPETANEVVAFTDSVIAQRPSNELRYSGYYLLTDENLSQLYVPSEENLSELAYLNEVKSRAKVLHSSITKQLSFLKTHGTNTSDFKYALGFQVANYNGNFQPGVGVSFIDEWVNVIGQGTVFRAGDVLLEFGGHSVFSPWDLMYQLNEHATTISKGIKKSIPFKLKRGNHIVTGSTLYFFNQNSSFWPKQEEGRAFWRSLIDGFTWGFDDEINNAFSKNKKKAFQYSQDKVRLAQFYSKTSLFGSVASGILSPGRLLFKRLVSKKLKKIGLKKGVNRLATNISLESIEGAIWTVGGSHEQHTTREIMHDIEQNMLWSALLGVGISSTSKLKFK